jgi:hypothetical protein
VRYQTALRLAFSLGRPPGRPLFLLLLPSSVLEDGVGLLASLTDRSLPLEKLVDLLGVGALAGPLNDPDKVASLSST